MLEKSASATSFEKYCGGIPSPNPNYPQNIKVVTGDNTITISNADNTHSTSYPISLGSLELCKIGSYQDYIYKDSGKWYKYGAIDKYIIPNNKSFSSTSQTGVYYISNFTDNHILFNNANIPICDKLVGTTPVGGAQSMAGKPNDTIAIINGSYDRLYFKCTEYETSSDILQGLKGSTIYYLIDTAIATEITDTTLIEELNSLYNAYSKYDDVKTSFESLLNSF